MCRLSERMCRDIVWLSAMDCKTPPNDPAIDSQADHRHCHWAHRVDGMRIDFVDVDGWARGGSALTTHDALHPGLRQSRASQHSLARTRCGASAHGHRLHPGAD